MAGDNNQKNDGEKLSESRDKSPGKSGERQAHAEKVVEEHKEKVASANERQAFKGDLEENKTVDVQPINPFEENPVFPFSDGALPNPEHETRYQTEDLEPKDEGDELDGSRNLEEKVENVDDINKAQPFNPFGDSAFEERTLEKKTEDDVDREFKKTAEKKAVEKEKEQMETGKDDQKSAEKQKKEIIEVEAVESKKVPVLEQVQHDQKYDESPEYNNFIDELKEILASAGLSVRKIAFGCASIAILILILLFVFKGGFGLFGGDDGDGGDGADSGEVVQNSTETELPEQDFSVVTSYIFGREFAGVILSDKDPFGGVKTGVLLGATLTTFDEDFVKYTATLRLLQNIFFTDVYKLLDLSTDRRSTIMAHILVFESLIKEAEVNLVQINEAIEELKLEFADIAAVRDQEEQIFFNKLQELKGGEASEELADFVDYGKQTLEIESKYNALVNLRGLYLNTLAATKPRLVDIRANVDALTKGIRVFNVPSSDINAIIQLPLNQ